MNKQVTFGHILTILAIIVIPLMIWGVNVERRFEKVIENSSDIVKIEQIQKEDDEKANKNYIEILKKLNSIELKVENKKDRE